MKIIGLFSVNRGTFATAAVSGKTARRLGAQCFPCRWTAMRRAEAALYVAGYKQAVAEIVQAAKRAGLTAENWNNGN